MGLDMYLTGRKYLWPNFDHPEQDRQEDGCRVEELRIRLGYWRKHPNLHGYIVREFADGVDECQEIFLTADNLRDIISAVKENRLPHTTGFFFGSSELDNETRKRDLEIFAAALKWLGEDSSVLAEPNRTTEIGGVTLMEYDVQKREWPRDSRDVIYRASW